MKTPDVHTKKLDDRSIQVVNLGREPGTKAYKVLIFNVLIIIIYICFIIS